MEILNLLKESFLGELPGPPGESDTSKLTESVRAISTSPLASQLHRIASLNGNKTSSYRHVKDASDLFQGARRWLSVLKGDSYNSPGCLHTVVACQDG